MLIHRLLAVGLCVCAVSVRSVEGADGPTGGFIVGANISSVRLTGSDAAGLTTGKRGGLFLGGFVVLPITDVVAIQPEVAYSQKHFTVQDSLSAFTATEKWDWIEVPVVARIRFWHAGDTAAYVLAGPGFSVLVRAREEAGGGTSDVKDDVKRADVSIIAGAGISIGKFGVEASYDGGLRDLNKDNALGDALLLKSRAIRVDVTWMFR